MTQLIARRPYWLLIGAAGVLVSAYVHFHLYFHGGYRGIAPEQFAGLTISRAFALNAIVGFLIAWALVVSVRVPRLATPSALAGFGFAAGTLLAYFLSRTTGLLGFEEDQTTNDAVIAMIAEIVALVSLGGWLVLAASAVPLRSSPTPTPSNSREATS